MERCQKSEPYHPADADEARLHARRWLVLTLNLASVVALTAIMTRVLGDLGWSVPTVAFLVIYLIGLPWTLMGFWNSVVGFVILRLVREPVGYVNPALHLTPPKGPITTTTAVCLAVRNEDVAAVFVRLGAMAESLRATGWGEAFDFHVLSDTNDPQVAADELRAFHAFRTRYPFAQAQYRRREANTSYKAGNLEEFVRRNRGYDHMIVLDADSLMSGSAMLRLVRAMQANPHLGILQTLVVGRPSESGFTRVFQFGMRHAMRAQTTGAAWWQGSSGPYWGHNAILRVAPFVDHCQLPVVPGQPPLGGPILSHDQVEAALMRGAGYEVRVIAEELESWEENPPNLPDFIKRDLRWCQGNLQYLKLLRMAGLKPMGRFQLIHAIMMYVGAPMSFLMLLAGLSIAVMPHPPILATSMAFGLYLTMMALGFAPRLLGVADILLRGEGGRFGGSRRLLSGSLLDALFSLLIGPVMMIAQTMFIVGLALGRRVAWDAQNRDDRSVGVGEAIRGLWPQMVFGACGAAILGFVDPSAALWAAPTLVPCLVSVPFACISSGRRFSRFLVRLRLCAVPDEFVPTQVAGATALPDREKSAASLLVEDENPHQSTGYTIARTYTVRNPRAPTCLRGTVKATE